MEDEIGEIELDPREYICDRCRLVHWTGASDACDRS